MATVSWRTQFGSHAHRVNARMAARCAQAATRNTRRTRSVVAHLLADLAERLLLQLANALAAQIVLVADLLQRELVLVVEAEPPPDDPRLDRRQRCEQPAHLVAPLTVREVIEGRERVLLLQEIDELAPILVTDRTIQRKRSLRVEVLY